MTPPWSLTSTRFPLAINDSRASLKYKVDLYPEESEIIAEAHFKLSLALEFASITSESETKEDAPKQIDETLREEAAVELEKAISSTKMKLQAKEVDLALIHDPEENEQTRKQIAEVKDMIADMEQRVSLPSIPMAGLLALTPPCAACLAWWSSAPGLAHWLHGLWILTHRQLTELRKPPVDVNSVLGADNPMTGILGATLGESASETKARVDEAKKNANDLSGLVRKKEKKPEPAAAADGTNGNGKRKAEDDAAAEEADSKKAKVEDVAA
jgi:HAT1-interacting factor 1